MYRLPRLLDANTAARALRGKRTLVILGRCIETEKPWALEGLRRLLGGDYAVLTACPEAEHINMIGFKLAGILARLPGIEEVVVLTTDGSMHCIQLHYVVEELEKIMPGRFRRRHLVATREGLVEVSPEAVKVSRFLSRVEKMLGKAPG